jgi:hypothetical protein
MSAPAGSSTSSAPSEVGEPMLPVYLHGAVSGLVGAATIGLWFSYLDFSRGRLLYTATLLGTLLFRGGGGLAPETLQPSLSIATEFALVHTAIFVVIGMAAARLLDLFEHRINVLLAIALLFVILGLGFLAFAMTFSAFPWDVLSLPDVLFGNVLAATTMVVHLWRRRPHHDEEGQPA